jgi:Ca-activated chloride channel family protein
LRNYFIIFLFLSVSIHAQDVPKTRILFLLDASYSMNKSWAGGTRWQTAMNTMYELTDSLAAMPNVEFALRIYGHQSSMRENNCRDSRLEMSFGNVNSNSIRKKLNNIQPNGVTPIAYSLEKCAADFAQTGDVSRNFLVLVTDGEESCGGDPCTIAQLLQRNNIILKPIVLGIQLPEILQQQFGCIGELINTTTSEDLKTQLKRVVNESVAKTTFQLNLLDAAGKPTETDVAFTLADAKTKISKYHFHHTMNARGMPDTIGVSPLFTYNVTVHTIPQLYIENVVMQRNIHNVISQPAAQGFLEVKFDGNVPKSASIEKIKCLVKRPNDAQTLHVQSLNSTEKYLTGKYEIEVLTLPVIQATVVSIDQTKTTTVKVPAPGMVTFNKNYELYGAVFIHDKAGLKKIYDLNETTKLETIALQPGKYRLIYRSKFAKTIHTTLEKDIEVVSGGSLSVKL